MTVNFQAFTQALEQEGYLPSYTQKMNARLQRVIASQLDQQGGIMWYADFLGPLADHLKDLHQAGKLFKGPNWSVQAQIKRLQDCQCDAPKVIDELRQNHPGKTLEQIAAGYAQENVQKSVTNRATYALLRVKNDAPAFSVSNVYTLLRKAFGLDQPYDMLQFTSDPQSWLNIIILGNTLWQKTLFEPCKNRDPRTFEQAVIDRLGISGIELEGFEQKGTEEDVYDAAVGAYHHLLGHLPVAYNSPRHAKKFLADVIDMKPIKGRTFVFRT